MRKKIGWTFIITGIPIYFYSIINTNLEIFTLSLAVMVIGGIIISDSPYNRNQNKRGKS